MNAPAIPPSLLEAAGDALPRPYANSYWLIPGQVLAGEHPGAKFRVECTARVGSLLDAGMREFVDLTDYLEGPGPYVPVLRELAQSRDLVPSHQRFAIPDFNVPTLATMRAILDTIYAAMKNREPVYLHCWGGVGRTGTVVGCLLREQGLPAADALALLDRKWRVMEKALRHERSPETQGQVTFVERWRSA